MTETNGTEGAKRSVSPGDVRLKRVRKIYLCVHALSWIEIIPEDQEEREKAWGGGEHWPGRTEACHRLDLQLREKQQRLIRDAGEDEAFFFLPTGLKGNRELIEFARDELGPRCVVSRFRHSLDQIRRELGDDYVRGIEEDRRRAAEAGLGDLSAVELEAWERSKAWAFDLDAQLREQGYTYDPADVTFVAFGENWVGCGATYPIQMGRVFGLTKPIERRFDLMNPDWCPIFMESSPVDQNLEMPSQVRLFIYRTGLSHSAFDVPQYQTQHAAHLYSGGGAGQAAQQRRGRYVAQYWEGIRGIMDPAHVVEVEFPPGSVREVDVFGVEVGRARGMWAGPNRSSVAMSVGGGVFTPYHSTLVMAEDDLPLEEFRAALLAGKVSESSRFGRIWGDTA
jgi:hypothetical protein